MCVKGSARTAAPFFTNLAGIPSRPAALE